MTGALIALALIVTPEVHHQEVVELNHVYDYRGNHVLDQLIGYSWNDETNSHEIDWWTSAKNIVSIESDRLHLKNGATVIWGVWHETWTQYDPELIDRDRRPIETRRGKPWIQKLGNSGCGSTPPSP